MIPYDGAEDHFGEVLPESPLKHDDQRIVDLPDCPKCGVKNWRASIEGLQCMGCDWKEGDPMPLKDARSRIETITCLLISGRGMSEMFFPSVELWDAVGNDVSVDSCQKIRNYIAHQLVLFARQIDEELKKAELNE